MTKTETFKIGQRVMVYAPEEEITARHGTIIAMRKGLIIVKGYLLGNRFLDIVGFPEGTLISRGLQLIHPEESHV